MFETPKDSSEQADPGINKSLEDLKKKSESTIEERDNLENEVTKSAIAVVSEIIKYLYPTKFYELRESAFYSDYSKSELEKLTRDIENLMPQLINEVAALIQQRATLNETILSEKSRAVAEKYKIFELTPEQVQFWLDIPILEKFGIEDLQRKKIVTQEVVDRVKANIKKMLNLPAEAQLFLKIQSNQEQFNGSAIIRELNPYSHEYEPKLIGRIILKGLESLEPVYFKYSLLNSKSIEISHPRTFKLQGLEKITDLPKLFSEATPELKKEAEFQKIADDIQKKFSIPQDFAVVVEGNFPLAHGKIVLTHGGVLTGVTQSLAFNVSEYEIKFESVDIPDQDTLKFLQQLPMEEGKKLQFVMIDGTQTITLFSKENVIESTGDYGIEAANFLEIYVGTPANLRRITIDKVESPSRSGPLILKTSIGTLEYHWKADKKIQIFLNGKELKFL